MKSPHHRAELEPEDNWINKCWGKTRCLLDSSEFSQHELILKSKSYCSLHYHNHRANRFIVTSGLINVVTFIGPEQYIHVLREGDRLDVPSLVLHMFIVLEDGSMLEEYYPDRLVNNKIAEVNQDDIVRLVEGGVMHHCNVSELLAELINKI